MVLDVIALEMLFSMNYPDMTILQMDSGLW